MKLRPLGDKVVVKRVEAEERTSGGIVLPDTAKEKPQRGKVISVGQTARRRQAGRPGREGWRPGPVHQLRRHGSEGGERRVPGDGRVGHHGDPGLSGQQRSGQRSAKAESLFLIAKRKALNAKHQTSGTQVIHRVFQQKESKKHGSEDDQV